MKKLLVFILPVVLAILVFFGVTYLLGKKNSEKGALQATSNPLSNVYLNGKFIGKTPLCKCEGSDTLATGDYTIKLVPIDTPSLKPFEQKIHIEKSVLTVVDRTFGDASTSQGSVISLMPLNDKTASEIFVSSFPTDADVTLDGNASGKTPIHLSNITTSDHELAVDKQGYAKKEIRVHTIAGYALTALVFLGVDLQAPVSSGSAIVPSSPAASPSATISPVPQVLILATPTGFLRVRDAASLGGNEIAQVKPGDTYPLVDEQNGWYEIKLTDGRTGWISVSYAKKQ